MKTSAGNSPMGLYIIGMEHLILAKGMNSGNLPLFSIQDLKTN
jgi:hypothetical protein